MGPFMKARVSRRARRDGKVGLPSRQDEHPPQIERLKEAANADMSSVLGKWLEADGHLAEALAACAVAREATARDLSSLEVELAAAAAEDEQIRGPEQAKLNDYQFDVDELTRRLDAGDPFDSPAERVESSPTPDPVDPPRPRRSRNRERESKRELLNDEIQRASDKLKQQALPEGVPFGLYFAMLCLLGLAEFPLNLLGFRILREGQNVTYLIALVPALVLMFGAHLIPILEEHKHGGTKAGLLALSCLAVLFGVFLIRVNYIEMRLADMAASPTAAPVVTRDGNAATPSADAESPASVSPSAPLPNAVPSLDSGFGNTGWGFFALNYGALAIALGLSYAHHGSRQGVQSVIARAQRKLDHLNDLDEDEKEEERKVVQRELEDRKEKQAKGGEADKPGLLLERKRRRAYEAAISSVLNSKMHPLQVARSQREEHLAALREGCKALSERLSNVAQDEEQRRTERDNAVKRARGQLLALRHDWNDVILAYVQANLRARSKAERAGEAPRGFASGNLKVEVPADYLAALGEVLPA